MIGAQEIDNLIQEFEWKFERFEGNLIWLGIIPHELGEFRLTIQIREEWVVVAIHPLISTPKPQRLTELCCHISLLNYQMDLVKLIMDEQKDIGMVTELPVAECNSELLKKAVNCVVHYAQNYRAELEALGQ